MLGTGGIELGRVSHQPLADRRTLDSAEEGRAEAHSSAQSLANGDRVSHEGNGDAGTSTAAPGTATVRAGRRRKYASLRTIGTHVLAAAGGAGLNWVGIGIRDYAVGQQAARLRRQMFMVPYGNISLNSNVADDFISAANRMRQIPQLAEKLDRIQAAPPNFLGEALDVQPASASRYDPIANTVFWNNTAKLEVAPSNKSEAVGVDSPFGALVHELNHVTHAIDSLPATLTRAALPHPAFDNLEEKITIEETNRDLANFPGESVRSDHHAAALGVAHGVADNSAVGFSKDAKTAIDLERSAYSENDPDFAASLNIMTKGLSAYTGIASDPLAKAAYPNSFNSSNVAHTQSLFEEGRRVSTGYATAYWGGTNATKIAQIEAHLDSYVDRAQDFAASLKEDGDTGNVTLASLMKLFTPHEPLLPPNTTRPIAPTNQTSTNTTSIISPTGE